MAVFRGKYILEGLGRITPEMESDLEAAYAICHGYKSGFKCELCGRCCHQANIIVRPGEVDSISSAAGVPLDKFIREYLVQTSDGRLLMKKTDPCAFLGKDNRCTIWKNRPEVCDDFPCEVSMFMSRVYLAITNEDADILDLISYMDDTWPCTGMIKSSISEKVATARKERAQRLSLKKSAA